MAIADQIQIEDGKWEGLEASAYGGSVDVWVYTDQEQADVPCFTSDTPWELWAAPDAMSLTVDADGTVQVVQEDSPNPTTYAKIQIQSVAELREIVRAFLNPRPPSSPETVFRPARMASLIEDIFVPVFVSTKEFREHCRKLTDRVPIPAGTNTPRPTHKLHLIRWADAQGVLPSIRDLRGRIDKGLQGEDTRNQDDFGWDYALSCVDPDDPRLVEPRETDIVVVGGEWIEPAMGIAYWASGLEFGVAFRLKAEASMLFVLDLLRYSVECEALRKELATAKSWQQWLQEKEIPVPGDPLNQIYQSIAFRQARQFYLSEVTHLSYGRQPFAAAQDLFIRRKEMVTALHNEMLLQVESVLKPMPFFIEYPYAQFIGSSDRAQRLYTARRVLDVLCKILLLLPLEELYRDPSSALLQKFVNRLQSRPQTNGALLTFASELRSLVKVEGWSGRFQIFDRLFFENAEIESSLRAVVTARNRSEHAPFDEKGFLNECHARVPEVVQRLRDLLDGVELIVPKQVRPGRTGSRILAVRVMGNNSLLRSDEFQTALPAGEFVVDELAAYRAEPRESLLPLSHWFETRSFSAETIDVGLFDRVENDRLIYSFVAHHFGET